MEETIKGIEVIAYKGMKSDMTCRDFQYEIGKTYKTDKVKLCEIGFHACLNPRDVLDYYSKETNSRYFKVLLSGKITKCGMWSTNVAATEITILEEITDTFNEVIKTEWWKNENVIDLLYFSDGFARVKNCDGKYNFIDKDGKYNFIDKDGKLLSDKWFEYVGIFYDGLARVQRKDGKWNFIDRQGNYLTEQWFEWADNFNDGFAKVQRRNGEWYNIDKTGKIIKNCSRIWKKIIKILQ